MSNDTVKKARVLTADDLAGLLEAAVAKIVRPQTQARPTRPDIDDLKRRQEKAILHHELNQEKRERVKKAIEREAPLEQQLAALGGEDSISPLELVKLNKSKAPVPLQQAQQPGIEHDLTSQVLGPSPSTRELERYADIRLKLRNSDVRSNERGEIILNGYPLQGSNLGTALRFIVKGSRGFKGQVPSGVVELGDLLKQQGIASSKFPESIRPLLGGRTGRNRGHQSSKSTLLRTPRALPTLPPTSSRPQSSDDEDSVDELANNLGTYWNMESSDGEQEGAGLDYLRCACDRAEEGNHDEAWDSLNKARQLRAPREKIKQVEEYLASLRD